MSGHALGERLRAYVKVARAPFLSLPVTLVLLGTATAWIEDGFDPVAASLAFLGLLFLHISINARNEYRDYKSGVDLETEPTPFSGGSKTLPEGEIEPVAAKRLATVTAGFGALIGGYFIIDVGLLLVPITILGAISVLFYTSHLTRFGLGELFAGLGLGGLPVLGTGLVQVGAITPLLIAVSVPSTLLTFDLLLLNEFPDQEADRKGNRRNLIHRLGRETAGLVYVAAAIGVPLSIALAWGIGLFPAWAVLGVLPSVLLVRPVSWAITAPETAVSLDAQRDNVLWILGTNSLLAVGIALPELL